MRGTRVGIRIDRDRGDPHRLGGAHHPTRDLAAIGDQDFLENYRFFRSRRSNQRPAPQMMMRSEEHTSELQSLMRISYAVFCLKKKDNIASTHTKPPTTN